MTVEALIDALGCYNKDYEVIICPNEYDEKKIWNIKGDASGTVYITCE